MASFRNSDLSALLGGTDGGPASSHTATDDEDIRDHLFDLSIPYRIRPLGQCTTLLDIIMPGSHLYNLLLIMRASSKVHLLCCASSLVITVYKKKVHGARCKVYGFKSYQFEKNTHFFMDRIP
jgi:hypothetical protein